MPPSKAALSHANLGIEKLRFFFRLATALKYLDVRRYAHAARQLDRLLWLREGGQARLSSRLLKRRTIHENHCSDQG